MKQTTIGKNINEHQQMIKSGCAGCSHTASCILFRYMKENETKKLVQIDSVHSADCKCPECSGKRKAEAIESLFENLEKEKKKIEMKDIEPVLPKLDKKEEAAVIVTAAVSAYENKSNYERLQKYTKTEEEAQPRENKLFSKFEAEIKNETYFFRENENSREQKIKEIVLPDETNQKEKVIIEDLAIVGKVQIAQLPIILDEEQGHEAANKEQGIEMEKRKQQHKTENEAKETAAAIDQEVQQHKQKGKRTFVIGEYTYEDILAIGWLRKLYGHLIGLQDEEIQSRAPKLKDAGRLKSHNIKQEYKSLGEVGQEVQKKSKENKEEQKGENPITKSKEVHRHEIKGKAQKKQEEESDLRKIKEEEVEKFVFSKTATFAKEQGRAAETKKENKIENEEKKRKEKQTILGLVRGIFTKRKRIAAKLAAKRVKRKENS